MLESRKIKSAFISVYYKDRLDEVLYALKKLGVHIYSTGGTQTFIESLGLHVTPVENLTGYPSILGGRVKTLHPKVFGGILARRNNPDDIKHLSQYEIPEFDLVIVDLYPFEETLKSTIIEQEIIEKIDIGGISLIRAAAKNYNDVVIVANRKQYTNLLELLEAQNGETTIEQRRKFAAEAFNTSSHYDTAIFNFFNSGNLLQTLKISETESQTMRYGENPHQKAYFYGNFDQIFDKIHGKDVSYNNLLDIDAALDLISEFTETTVAILKHTNACGLASRPTLFEAWNAALSGDPISAFGGIIITNKMVDAVTADEIDKLFFEVIIAPSYDPEAVEILQKKKNRIILIQKQSKKTVFQVKSAVDGFLVQQRDQITETPENLKVVTKKGITESETDDLIFANKIVKHSKSNAIVLAKNKQLIGNGVGQTSRIDALKQAITKANSYNFDLNGSVLASDAFFPFSDSVEIAYKAGIRSIIQPGGSIKDSDSINYCDANDMAMVFTGIRHFKH